MKWLIVLSAVIVVLIGVLLINNRSTNNACKTFGDYYTNRDSNENCYYNPDGDLTAPEIIHRYGYPCETHEVLTKDGYKITVFRIPYGKNSTDKKRKGKPILLQHGNSVNGGIYFHTGRKSLGFILADAGFDVWIGNFRGTMHARNHTLFSSKDSRFWDFSFHEHGIYDIPAHVDYIYEKTKRKIVYVGYSMGGAAIYVYGTTFPETAREKLEIIVGLAPAVFMKNTSHLSQFLSMFWFLIGPTLQVLTNGPITPKGFLPNSVQKFVCLPYPFQMKMCEFWDMLNMGFDYDQSDPETLPTTVQRNSDATSIKTVTHFTQLIRTGNFQYFDYGSEENEKHYGSPEPPHYNLSKITVRSYLVGAENDVLIKVENIKKLREALPKNLTPDDVYVVNHKNFNHADFFVAKDVVKLFYNHLVKFITNL